MVVEVAVSGLLERFKFWGWRVTVVSVILFLVVVGLSLVFGFGINGLFTLPIISLVLVVLAIVFLVGLVSEMCGSVGIWLRKRITPSQTSRTAGVRRARGERSS
jgi:predicted RND superfamily exporter protein